MGLPVLRRHQLRPDAAGRAQGLHGAPAGLAAAAAPEAFGLHENADITCAQNEVKDLFETLLSLQPRVSAGAGLSREQVIDQVAEGLLSRMPKEWLMLDVCKSFPITYEESMNTVLQQECMRYNKLLALMRST